MGFFAAFWVFSGFSSCRYGDLGFFEPQVTFVCWFGGTSVLTCGFGCSTWFWVSGFLVLGFGVLLFGLWLGFV